MAWVILFIKNTKVKSMKDQSIKSTKTQNVETLAKAQHQIIRVVQHKVFKKEFMALKPNGTSGLTKASDIYQLDPFIDNCELL